MIASRGNVPCFGYALLLASIVRVLLASAAPSADQRPARDAVLEQYIELALGRNPGVTAADARRDAAEELIAPAAALADPMITFGLKEYPLEDSPEAAASRMERAGKWIGVEQQFPFPGMRSARREAAANQWRMQAAMSEQERVMLSAEIKGVYYEWSRIRGERELVQAGIDLLTQVSDLVRSSFSAGMSTLADVAAAAAELARMEADLTELDAMEEAAKAELRALCLIPGSSAMASPVPLSFALIQVGRDSLTAAMKEANPRLSVAAATLAMTEAEIKMARRERYPMFTLGAEYMRRAGTDDMEEMPMGSVMGGLTIPLYSGANQNHVIRARQHEQRQAQAERVKLETKLDSEVARDFALQSSLQAQIETYRDQVIPSARQAFEARLAAYRSAQGEFMFVLDARMNSLAAERKLLELTENYLSAWSRLESLAGTRLF